VARHEQRRENGETNERSTNARAQPKVQGEIKEGQKGREKKLKTIRQILNLTRRWNRGFFLEENKKEEKATQKGEFHAIGALGVFVFMD